MRGIARNLGNDFKPFSDELIKLYYTSNVRGKHIGNLKLIIWPKRCDCQLVSPAITSIDSRPGSKVFPFLIINNNLCTLLSIANGEDAFLLPIASHISSNRSNSFLGVPAFWLGMVSKE